MEESYSNQPIVDTITTVDHPNPTAVNNSNTKKKKKKQNTMLIESVQQSASSSSSSNSQRVVRVLNKRRRIQLDLKRRVQTDVDAVAFLVGMSIASVLSQVLEKKDVLGEQLSVDHLSMICTLAVRESVAIVFGNKKFDGFVTNFEKSFRSTLQILRLINDGSKKKQKDYPSPSSIESNTSIVFSHMLPKNEVESMDHGILNNYSESNIPTVDTWEQLSSLSGNQEIMQTSSSNLELALNSEENQQLARINSDSHGYANNSMLCPFERSVKEQTRANDLKTFEISLQLKNLRLKETKLALDSDSNILERVKLSMGFSKMSFKADKFKNQLEETRHAELLRKCMDCLVAGLFIMSMSLGYGAYVHSYNRIVEAIEFCAPKSKSWWIPKPVSTFNSGIQTLGCLIQVLSHMLFGILMILIIASFLHQRSSTARQGMPITFTLLILGLAFWFAGKLCVDTMILIIVYLLLKSFGTARQGMPITFILLILGVVCGFAGKLCVDTLGGSGYHWLIYWEALCIFHFFSNVCTSNLFIILHGPVTEKRNSVFPYWIRRILFYATLLLFLPMLCGLMPFATPGEWKDHFVVLFTDFMRKSN